MAWPVRSTRFGIHAGSRTGGTLYVLATVPAGKVWLLKDWSVVKSSGGTGSFYIYVRSGGTEYAVDGGMNLVAGGVLGNAERNLVLNEGEQIVYLSSVTAVLNVQASGAQLS